MGWEGDELSVVFITQSAFFLLLWLEHHSGPQLSRTGPLVLFRQTFFFQAPHSDLYILYYSRYKIQRKRRVLYIRMLSEGHWCSGSRLAWHTWADCRKKYFISKHLRWGFSSEIRILNVLPSCHCGKNTLNRRREGLFWFKTLEVSVHGHLGSTVSGPVVKQDIMLGAWDWVKLFHSNFIALYSTRYSAFFSDFF